MTGLESRTWFVCDEFLTPDEADLVYRRALADIGSYRPSSVTTDPHQSGRADHRRSMVRFGEAMSMSLLRVRLLASADSICERLRIRPFPVTRLELQMTCSGDGDYYRPHRDDVDIRLRSRHITCVYYFHREPRAFQGGDLRLHQQPTLGMPARERYVDIEPLHNRLVVFRGSVLHEVRTVSFPSNRFADRRFSMNAWLHT